MFGILGHSGAVDESLIDDRNARPLTIALATIVVVWSIASALTLASGHLGAGLHSPANVAAVTSRAGK